MACWNTNSALRSSPSSLVLPPSLYPPYFSSSSLSPSPLSSFSCFLLSHSSLPPPLSPPPTSPQLSCQIMLHRESTLLLFPSFQLTAGRKLLTQLYTLPVPQAGQLLRLTVSEKGAKTVRDLIRILY